MEEATGNLYQNVIAMSKYARWIEKESRRETYSESITRYLNFFSEHLNETCKIKIPEELLTLMQNKLENFQVMPSMRALMTAGPALARDHIAGYNCAYTSISRTKTFSEILYVLMCGAGVGFSVERQFICGLPTIPAVLKKSDEVIIVEDSKYGWVESFATLIDNLYDGYILKWDTSKLRPAGSILHTMGGRSSGPQPLIGLFSFAVNVFMGAIGRKLTSDECHGLCCYIGNIVVVGGVRRAALISLSNLSDDRMRDIKTGEWYRTKEYLRLANNSACYTEKPGMGVFMKEWISLYNSKSGERGIFNRDGAKKHIASLGRRNPNQEFGCNPCSEIFLADGQCCNLTEVPARNSDTFESLAEKVMYAAILGTWQATLTNFKVLSGRWRRNCEEEALLGVSLTGIMDCPILNGATQQSKENLPELLRKLKNIVIETNKIWAKKLGINQSVATTCVKPSGTVSQLVNSSSGIHPRYSKYYIRAIRGSKLDPISQVMIQSGIPYELDSCNSSDYVFSFPIKSPEGSITRDDVTAIQQLELWLVYQKNWCEHKPSVTIYIKEHEWMEVGAWVYEHFDDVSGIAFLPYDAGIYTQAPYIPCSEEEYNEKVKMMPKRMLWENLKKLEHSDKTTSAKEFACTGDKCEFSRLD
jgi:ribonucleoside-diphosphate reductase alpha chain